MLKDTLINYKDRIKKNILRIIDIIKNFIFIDIRKVIRNFVDHDGELSTCSLAFYFLISFIPGSLVIISILSFFYESGDVVSFYLDQIQTQLPSIDINEFISIIDRIIYSKRYLAFIWVPFLFWWGSFVFDIIETGLEKAFRIGKSRRYWKAKIRHFLIIIGIGIFALILTVLSNLFSIFKNSDIALFFSKNLSKFYLFDNFITRIIKIPFVLSSATTLIINTFLIFIIYRFVPPKKLKTTSLLKGALFASLSYEIVKSLFSYYITEINDYSSIFGPLNTIVILMIWIWYTCFIFIFGAEAAWVYYEKSQKQSHKQNI